MEDFAVVVTSYDGFSDVWPIAKALFDRHWPDRTWPMYWMSNTRPVPEGTLPLHVHPDRQWCGNILAVVDSLPPYVLVWCEELFLLGPLNNELLLRGAELLKNDDQLASLAVGHYYYRHGFPGGDEYGNADFSTFHGYAEASTQPTLWRSSVLKEILIAVQEIADREYNHPANAGYSPVYTTAMEQKATDVLWARFPNMKTLRPKNQRILGRYAQNAIMYGKWRQAAVDALASQNIDAHAAVRTIIGSNYDGFVSDDESIV